MSRFYNFDGDIVNLDHVRAVRHRYSKSTKKHSTIVEFADGTSKTYEGQNHHGFERRTAPVIPATPGFENVLAEVATGLAGSKTTSDK
jgi:hypothetical protein